MKNYSYYFLFYNRQNQLLSGVSKNSCLTDLIFDKPIDEIKIYWTSDWEKLRKTEHRDWPTETN